MKKYYLIYDSTAKMAAIWTDKNYFDSRWNALSGQTANKYIRKSFDSLSAAESYLNQTKCQKIWREYEIRN